MIRIAMLFGFVGSYPVNAWLLRRGIDERCSGPRPGSMHDESRHRRLRRA